MAFRIGRRAKKVEPEPDTTSTVIDDQTSAVQEAAAARVDAQSELESETEGDAVPDSAGGPPDESGAAEEIAHLIGSTTTAAVDDPFGQNKPTEAAMEALLADEVGPHTEEDPEPGDDIDQATAEEVIGAATDTSDEGGPAIDMTADPGAGLASLDASARARFIERLNELASSPADDVATEPTFGQGSIAIGQGNDPGIGDPVQPDMLITEAGEFQYYTSESGGVYELKYDYIPETDTLELTRQDFDTETGEPIGDPVVTIYDTNSGTVTTILPGGGVVSENQDGTQNYEPPPNPEGDATSQNYEEYVDPEIQRILDQAIPIEDTRVVDYYRRQRGQSGDVDPGEGDGSPAFGSGTPTTPVPDAQQELLIGPGGDPRVPDTGGGGIHTDPTAGGDVDPHPDDAGEPQTSGPSERDTSHDMTGETEHPSPTDGSEEEADSVSFLPPPSDIESTVDAGPDVPTELTGTQE